MTLKLERDHVTFKLKPVYAEAFVLDLFLITAWNSHQVLFRNRYVVVIIDLKIPAAELQVEPLHLKQLELGTNQFQVHQPFAREQWFPNSLQPWEHPSGIKHAWHRAPRLQGT